MTNKDLPEKLLEDYNDIFADIVNVLLFNGERIIKEDELQNLQMVSQYKAETWNVVDDKDGDNMSEKWIDVIEARGEEKGEVRGKILAYHDMGLTIDEIAKKINISINQVRNVLGLEPAKE